MVKELTAEQVRTRCDPELFNCDSTADLNPLQGIIGQDRALSALQFGLHINKPGFNIFVSGLSGTGKTTIIKSFLDALAAEKEVPPDWCYVHNFKDSYSPKALRVPSGMGEVLKKDMKRAIDSAKRSLIQAFTSKEYAERREEITEGLRKKKEATFNELSDRAREKGLLLQTSQIGLILIPASDDQPMKEEDYHKLSQEEKDAIMGKRDELTKELKERLTALQAEESDIEKRLDDTDHEVAGYSVSFIFNELRQKYGELPQVVNFLNDVEQDISDNYEQFKADQKPANSNPLALLQGIGTGREQTLKKYEVNVLVDNSGLEGAPVILELNPTFNNMFGRIEKEAQFGALSTDFSMIKSGSLHKANGGYLVLRIEDLLPNFQSWDGLKRTLRDGKLIIEEIGERLGFMATKSLRPEAIPLDIKVVLIGEPAFYYILLRSDMEFKELFKVKADFDTQMDKTEPNLKEYAAVLCRICNEEDLKHLQSNALAKIMEYSSRLAGDQEKLSTLFADITDIIREANFWTKENDSKLIEVEHIDKAIDEKIYRSNLIQQRINEMINQGMIMIDTEGSEIGQVNGLAVIDLGDFAFGRPSRITASAGVGRDGLVDIEREAKLGGRFHTKGVMILNGHISEKYGSEFPLSMSARLVFEQSYDEVDGDSASSTELYAILSRLADVPIKQNIAVTGSVNQKGEVQVIGGINQKIEGFFEVCQAKGLTGEQGVMMPAGNVRNLMLKDKVVEAIQEGKFHIYPVNTIEEGIEVLTGVTAGKRLGDGSFEPDSINDKVQKKLESLAQKLRDFSKGEEKEEKKEVENESENSTK